MDQLHTAIRPLCERVAFLACLVIAVVLAGCKSRTATISAARVERSGISDTQKKLQNCTKLLMDSMQKPSAPFHFSYKAQENINPKFPMDKTAKPEVGPVELEADISPDEIDIASVRGGKKTERKVMKTDPGGLALAQLDLIGPTTSTGILLAFGQLAARPSGPDSVGGVAADKYDFDTSAATGTNRAALDIAKSMLTNIQNTQGTVWLEKASGRLVKFNINADYADKNGNSWKEHYEGEVTPK